jgi:rod shape-determining protein MreD
MTYSGGRMLLSSQRESQVSRFNLWVTILVPFLALLFQIYVPLFFRFLNFLEMPLLVVVYLGLMRRNPVSGLLVGAAVGLAQDAWSKNPLGMFGITKTLVGYFAASIGMKLDVEPGVFLLRLSPGILLGDGARAAEPAIAFRPARLAGPRRIERPGRRGALPLSRQAAHHGVGPARYWCGANRQVLTLGAVPRAAPISPHKR